MGCLGAPVFEWQPVKGVIRWWQRHMARCAMLVAGLCMLGQVMVAWIIDVAAIYSAPEAVGHRNGRDGFCYSWLHTGGGRNKKQRKEKGEGGDR